MNRTDELLTERWLSGVLTRKIGDELGVSWSAVCRRAKALGLPPRPRGRRKGFTPTERQREALRRGPLVSGKTQQERAWERAQQRMREMGILG